ncbi:MAG: hypothetical protein ABSH56_20555 [Bryobacteraceae bacterium]|jgi:hypothetical protein
MKSFGLLVAGPVSILILAHVQVWAQPPDPISVALYTQFSEPPPPAVADAMERELLAIMRPAGLQFDWRSTADADHAPPAAEIAVARFFGRCDARSLTSHIPNPGPLGWTHISDGAILHFTDVDCNRLRDFLEAGMLHLPPPERAAVFGRAMGRVLAHEIYHIFANTQRHGSGVSKAAYSVEDLLNGVLRLDKLGMERMSAGLHHSSAPWPPDVALSPRANEF